MSDNLPETTTVNRLLPSVVDIDEFQRVIEKLSDDIARRTRQLANARRNQGVLPDWMHAEAELLRPVPVRIFESNSSIRLVADVPGFESRDIRVSVDRRRLLIIGRAGDELVGSTDRARRILRLVVLPDPVVTTGVAVTLNDGVLEIVLQREKR
ncbi:MAG TPA: Hsp20/alpha crystallin family protein [Blastocatellia bacterium]|nr:Hsp20/alpha crystallin family protein [Blastocatellia bacterium]